jgi:molybdopterin-binding protein
MLSVGISDGSGAVARLAGVENILDGRISSNQDGLATVMVNGVPIVAITPLPAGTPVTLYMRPEDITSHADDGKKISARNRIHGRIVKVIPIGPMVRMKVDAGIHLVLVITLRSYDELGLSEGADIGLAFKASAIHVVERKG